MSKRSVAVSGWAVLSAVASGLVALTSLLLYRDSLFLLASGKAAAPAMPLAPSQPSAAPALAKAPPPPTLLGPRHQLTYEAWVALLAQEAQVAIEQRPPHLHILAGDSISLWFPADLLPPNFTWLNQGISGDTSDKLLRRLALFDAAQPEVVFVMIGINDLLKGEDDATLLDNHQAIVRHLKATHPQATIVLQSILPHVGEQQLRNNRSTPAWARRLAIAPNQRIRALNQKLAQLAAAEGGRFLNLYPDFADAEGNLLAALSTDGLHLSRQGYQVWRSRLDQFLSDHQARQDSTLDLRTGQSESLSFSD